MAGIGFLALLLLLGILVIGVIYRTEAVQLRVIPAAERHASVNAEIVGIPNPSQNVKISSICQEFIRCVRLELTRATKEPSQGLSRRERLVSLLARFSLVRAFCLEWAILMVNPNLTNNLLNMGFGTSGIGDIELPRTVRASLYSINGNVAVTRLRFSEVKVSNNNSRSLCKDNSVLYCLSLPFQNFQRTDSHGNATNSNQNEVDSWQTCRSKYATEIGVRMGAGPACLVLGLLLIGTAILTADEHRVRGRACGCTGLALLIYSVAVLCLQTYYDCGDYDSDGRPYNRFQHANTVPPHRNPLEPPC